MLVKTTYYDSSGATQEIIIRRMGFSAFATYIKDHCNDFTFKETGSREITYYEENQDEPFCKIEIIDLRDERIESYGI